MSTPAEIRREGLWAAPWLLAGAVWLAWVDHFPAWMAESWTKTASCAPFADLWQRVAADRNPPLFFLLEGAVCRVAGGGDAALRLPALAFALAAGWMTVRIVRRSLGDPAGWVATAFLATSPYLGIYALTARPGTLNALLGALLLDTSLRADTRTPRATSWRLALWSTLALYTHYGNAVAVVGAALATAVVVGTDARDASPGRSRDLLTLAMGPLLAGVAFLPWWLGPMATQDVTHTEGQARTLEVFRYLTWPVGPVVTTPVAAALVLVALAGAALLVVRGTRAQRGALGWLLAMVVVPYAWSQDPSTHWKFYIYGALLPVFAWFLARGSGWLVERVKHPHVAMVGAVVTLAAGQLPTVLEVARLPASPASIEDTPTATWDPRRDVEVLEAAGRRARVRVGGDTPALAALLHYRAGLVQMEAPPDVPSAASSAPGRQRLPDLLLGSGRQGTEGPAVDLPVTLHAWQHPQAPEPPSSPTPERACVLSEAFSVGLWSERPDVCQAVLAAIAEHAEGYAPFLTELATVALQRGELDEAERLARAAAAAPSGTSRAWLRLADVLEMREDLVGATEALDAALERARRFGRKEEERVILVRRIELLRRAHRATPSDEDATVCAAAHIDDLWGAWPCDHAWLRSFLHVPGPGEGGPRRRPHGDAHLPPGAGPQDPFSPRGEGPRPGVDPQHGEGPPPPGATPLAGPGPQDAFPPPGDGARPGAPPR